MLPSCAHLSAIVFFFCVNMDTPNASAAFMRTLVCHCLLFCVNMDTPNASAAFMRTLVCKQQRWWEELAPFLTGPRAMVHTDRVMVRDSPPSDRSCKQAGARTPQKQPNMHWTTRRTSAALSNTVNWCRVVRCRQNMHWWGGSSFGWHQPRHDPLAV